jgi:hypothetical protein
MKKADSEYNAIIQDGIASSRAPYTAYDARLKHSIAEYALSEGSSRARSEFSSSGINERTLRRWTSPTGAAHITDDVPYGNLRSSQPDSSHPHLLTQEQEESLARWCSSQSHLHRKSIKHEILRRHAITVGDSFLDRFMRDYNVMTESTSLRFQSTSNLQSRLQRFLAQMDNFHRQHPESHQLSTDEAHLSCDCSDMKHSILSVSTDSILGINSAGDIDFAMMPSSMRSVRMNLKASIIWTVERQNRFIYGGIVFAAPQLHKRAYSILTDKVCVLLLTFP